MTPLVTVVVPTHGRQALLRRTLDAVLGQTGVPLEVVVVVDGVVDGTRDHLASRADDRLRMVVHERALGVCAARNAGLAAAQGTWTAFCDDDDLWLPDKLSRQVQALRGRPDAGWSVGACVRVDATLRLRAGQPAPPGGDVGSLLLARNAVPGGGSGVVARTELLRDLGGFDPSLRVLADWDMWIRLGLASPLAAVEIPLLAYVLHGEGMSHGLGKVHWEYQRIRDGYAAERAARGVRVDEARWLLWVGDMQRRGGRRRASARTALRRARLQPSPRRCAAVPATLMAPRLVARVTEQQTARRIPEEWRVRSEAFLAEVRAGPAHLSLAN